MNNSSLPEYTYDANGNMTSDLNKRIIGIRYNNQNLPTEIQMPLNCSILYSYDALGNKRAQYVYQPGGLVKTTYFVSNFVIENNVPMYSLYDEGRIVYDKGLTISSVEVNMKDHLGNVRAVFDITTGQVKQTNTYYPFGMQNSSLSANTTTTKNFNEYKYNGKMFQDENGLNWYDYGARYYDAVVGRWWSVDPLGEISRSWSPYNYGYSNPIRFIDSDGRLAHDPPIPGLNSMWGNKEIIPTAKSLIASSVNGPLLVTTGVVMPIIGNIVDGTNGDFQGYPSWASPITFSNDWSSLNFRTEMMGENIPFESGMELLGATTGVVRPTVSENPILDRAIGVIAEEGINAIPDLVQTNDKSETKTKTPITNEGSSSAGSSKEKNIHMEFWENQLYSPNEKKELQ